MEINQNLTNLIPIDSKLTGGSGLQKSSENQSKENVVEKIEVKSLEVVKPVDAEDLSSAITIVSEHIQNVRHNLEFSIDKESGRDVVKILDAETQEIIRQYPSDEILVLARHLREQLNVDDKDKTVNLFSSIA